MMPSNGLPNSTMRKTAAATDTAEMARTVTTVALRGVPRPKLAKVIDSQKNPTVRKIRCTPPPALPTSRDRVRKISSVKSNALDLSHRCSSVLGARRRIWFSTSSGAEYSVIGDAPNRIGAPGAPVEGHIASIVSAVARRSSSRVGAVSGP